MPALVPISSEGMAAPKRKRVLILDTGALVGGNDSLFSLGGLIDADGNSIEARDAEEEVEFHMVPDVASEVRDPRARARLNLISESVVVREPSAEAVDLVVQFSKATGDFAALSRVDLRVLALAQMLEIEANGGKYLRPAPVEPVFQAQRTVPLEQVIAEEDEKKRSAKMAEERRNLENDGWEEVVTNKNPGRPKLGKKTNKGKKGRRSAHASVVESSERSEPQPKECKYVSTEDVFAAPTPSRGGVSATPAAGDFLEKSDGAGFQDINETFEFDTATEVVAALSKLDVGNTDSRAEVVEDVDVEDDGVGWISPENVDEQLARDGGGQEASSDEEQRVGCITTDFAMQNVLLQMGINVVSVDGRRVINRLRRYVLRCQSCTEITREVERMFCGRCGNASLTRVSYDVDKNGVARIFLSSKFKPRLRGTKYPIPMPRGGRNNKDLILCEDQIDPAKLRRAAKERERREVDVLDPDTSYKVGGRYNPGRQFVVGYGARNPNEGKPSTKSSKRK